MDKERKLVNDPNARIAIQGRLFAIALDVHAIVIETDNGEFINLASLMEVRGFKDGNYIRVVVQKLPE